MMNLVFCKHEGNKKQYLFEVSMSVSLDMGADAVYGVSGGKEHKKITPRSS
mgnify:CR=1 FL=1